MKLVINSYSTDGSSLSSDRCTQIKTVFEMCDALGARPVSYRDIQDIAVERKIFGDAKADSVIRTIFPLLKKIGFVNYPEDTKFAANSFFSDLGKSFVKTITALEMAEQLDKKEAISKIELARQYHLLLGIDNLAHSEYKNHNILLSLELLKQEKVIYWNELLFFLNRLQNGTSLSEAIKEAKDNRLKNVSYEYVNTKGAPIANTSYSYVRLFLIEAGIIPNSKSMFSEINYDKLKFIESLPTYEY